MRTDTITGQGSEYTIKNFMLKKPEKIKFGVFHMGKIKGTLRRKDLYEGR